MDGLYGGTLGELPNGVAKELEDTPPFFLPQA